VKQHEVHTWDGNIDSAVIENTLYVAVPMDDGHVLGMTGSEAEDLRNHLDAVLEDGE
jgi:hypothetical protein